MSGFAEENGTGLGVSVGGGCGWVVAPSVEGEEAGEDCMLAPVPFPKILGNVDDGTPVELDGGACGFTNENGEREEVVVGAFGAVGKSVDGVAAGTEVDDNEKPGPVVEATAAVPLIESLVLAGVAKDKVEMFDLLCELLSHTFPSATDGAGVRVIVGTGKGLVPSSGAVTLVGISTNFWGGT